MPLLNIYLANKLGSENFDLATWYLGLIVYITLQYAKWRLKTILYCLLSSSTTLCKDIDTQFIGYIISVRVKCPAM